MISLRTIEGCDMDLAARRFGEKFGLMTLRRNGRNAIYKWER